MIFAPTSVCDFLILPRSLGFPIVRCENEIHSFKGTFGVCLTFQSVLNSLLENGLGFVFYFGTSIHIPSNVHLFIFSIISLFV